MKGDKVGLNRKTCSIGSVKKENFFGFITTLLVLHQLRQFSVFRFHISVLAKLASLALAQFATQALVHDEVKAVAQSL